MPTSEIEARLRFFAWLAVLGSLLVLTVVTLSIAVLVYLSITVGAASRDVKHVVENNRAVLCAVQANANKQVAASEEFLLKHPDGIPGISISELRASIARQRAFATALSDLTC